MVSINERALAIVCTGVLLWSILDALHTKRAHIYLGLHVDKSDNPFGYWLTLAVTTGLVGVGIA